MKKSVLRYDRVIGSQVKILRKQAGLAQFQLAPKLGLDQSALSRIENGNQTLSAAQWVRLCSITGTPDSFAERVLKCPN